MVRGFISLAVRRASRFVTSGPHVVAPSGIAEVVMPGKSVGSATVSGFLSAAELPAMAHQMAPTITIAPIPPHIHAAVFFMPALYQTQV